MRMGLDVRDKHGSGPFRYNEIGRRARARPTTVLELTSMTDNDNDTDKRTVLENEQLGSRQVGLGGVDGAAVSVETPDLFTEEEIGVTAYAYDDIEGEVVLTFGSDVLIGVTLDASDARALAERIDAAADEADAEL